MTEEHCCVSSHLLHGAATLAATYGLTHTAACYFLLCVHPITALTSQNFAPYLGGGESQNLNLLRVPPPQEEVQCVQPLQAPHPPESVSATLRHTAVATRSLIRTDTHQMLQLSDALQ